jgi:hypothetical protein
MGMFDGIKLGGGATRGGASPQGGTTLEHVSKLLDQTGLRYEGLETGSIRLIFGLDDDRVQQIVIQDGGELGELPIINVVSPVADLNDHPISPEAAIGLLQASGQLKVGSFFIGGETLLFGYTAFLADLSPDLLCVICQVVAQTADEAEGDLTGQDVY